MSKTYRLKRTQVLNCNIEEAWRFFSDPANLAAITPASMGFKVISANEPEMYPGQIIEYRVSPLFGISMYWMTEITHVEHQKYFVDEQRFGPYKFWHHQHHFRPLANGVEMTDLVHYRIPFWLFGDLANAILVRAKLRDIFDHRYRICAEKFG